MIGSIFRLAAASFALFCSACATGIETPDATDMSEGLETTDANETTEGPERAQTKLFEVKVTDSQADGLAFRFYEAPKQTTPLELNVEWVTMDGFIGQNWIRLWKLKLRGDECRVTAIYFRPPPRCLTEVTPPPPELRVGVMYRIMIQGRSTEPRYGEALFRPYSHGKIVEYIAPIYWTPTMDGHP
jgi:hypothetical protein